MKPWMLLLLAALLTGNGSASVAALPRLPRAAAQLNALVPRGWKIEQQLYADFDRDGQRDVLLVLRQNDPRQSFKYHNANPRLLAAAFKRTSGYQLAFQSSIIPTQESNMEDPLSSLTVQPGGFQLGIRAFFSMGSWSMSNTTFTVRRQDGCFRIIGYDTSEVQRNSGETLKLSVNYLTGRVQTITGHISQDAEREVWSKLKRNPRRCIQDIRNAFEFQPQPSVASGG